MKNPKFYSLAILLALLVVSAKGNALGLGGIILKSESGNPLNAHILLHSFKQSDLGTISVRNAPRKYYKKYSVSSSPYIRSLRYKLVINKDDHSAYIVVKHKSQPKKKVLKFVVEITWENGKLIKPYTLLIDGG